MDKLQYQWQHWRLKYTTILVISLVVFYFVARTEQVEILIQALSSYGYWGAFVAGIFFVSAYTAVPAGFVLYGLGDYFNPVQIALVGGLGAMIGDYLIFRFVRDRLYEELKPHFKWFGRYKNNRRKKMGILKILMPTLGMIIIASPLPDEIGVSLLGFVRMNSVMFLILTYILNSAGIFLLALIAHANR